MHVSILSLVLFGLLATSQIMCMDHPEGTGPFMQFPASYQLGKSAPIDYQSLPVQGSALSGIHDGQHSIATALAKVKTHQLQELLTQGQQIVAKQQQVCKQHALIGSAHTTAKISLGIALLGAANCCTDAIMVSESKPSQVIYRMIGMGLNLITTFGATGLLVNRYKQKTTYAQQLQVLITQLEQLDTHEPSLAEPNIAQNRIKLYNMHELIGSHDVALTGLSAALTVCTFNAMKESAILYLSDNIISLIADSINGGIAIVIGGLVIRSLILDPKDRRVTNALQQEIEQLILNEQEQEEI